LQFAPRCVDDSSNGCYKQHHAKTQILPQCCARGLFRRRPEFEPCRDALAAGRLINNNCATTLVADRSPSRGGGRSMCAAVHEITSRRCYVATLVVVIVIHIIKISRAHPAFHSSFISCSNALQTPRLGADFRWTLDFRLTSRWHMQQAVLSTDRYIIAFCKASVVPCCLRSFCQAVTPCRSAGHLPSR
jgi:hypothetical protein